MRSIKSEKIQELKPRQNAVIVWLYIEAATIKNGIVFSSMTAGGVHNGVLSEKQMKLFEAPEG